MKKAIFCLAASDEQARRIVDSLLSSQFSNTDISVLYPERKWDQAKTPVSGEVNRVVEKTGGGCLSTEKHTKAPEGGVTGGVIGGVLGGSLGLLVGIGALAIPGLGPFIAAGPLLAALSGTGVGGGIGLLLGALIGSGIPEYEAKKYETGLREGNILLCVHCDTAEQIKRAHDIMKKEGAKDISVANEKAKSAT